MTQLNSPDTKLDDFLVRHSLAAPDEHIKWEPLTGGVSSDIWRAELPRRTLCVKRALSTLKVSSTWEAPVSRNADEWAWMQFAAIHCPANVPTPLAHDPELGAFAMSFLEPDSHPVWKKQLMEGRVDSKTAAAVGRLIGHLHAVSALDADVAAKFDTTDNFKALRLDPYFAAAGAKHEDLAERLRILSDRTANTRIALVHGDVSPKNILVGPNGPVLLDAECAWFGDPAFDLAFCLNHLLLKCLLANGQGQLLLESFAALKEAYFSEVNWEPHSILEGRAADLLPALLLARVDGQSPVEYINNDAQRQHVRTVAWTLLQHPPTTLDAVAQAWQAECAIGR
ncbi:methylthioribose kinase [Caballeronia arvi]|uniref:Methylthioribose kinase n=1 Tax=Caballeronia arvi TaxID=1777135 RepID=A0A158J2W1_9BURK|nr:aminoglycoside phosphotransferase family protein [Caballeronia arvi]SAL63188.1 methylthioribose kinase [Caballeronia arvi]